MEVKNAARKKLDAIFPEILQLSRQIHANPEMGFEEVKAVAWITEMLANAGFKVKRSICDLPTAFSATVGTGPLHIAICAEYDALPGIGHACGHNVIAAAGVGAAIAASVVADIAGVTVSVIGTPAEEKGDGGGKILLLERGGFSGIHAAMMIHPGPSDILMPKVIAASMFEVNYTGREAHASSYPELGINALDALTVAQTAIGLLRQHIPSTARIHGIITHGGDAPNVVPARTSARYIVRGQTLAELESLRPRVYRCFEAGALATGAQLEIVGGEKPYSEMIHDRDIADLYRRNAESLERPYPEPDASGSQSTISTDMGNVSHKIPSIHPMIGIDSFPAVNHQKEFADHCITAAANHAIYDGALAMAWTIIDIAANRALRHRLLRES
jgi:amidohydrolase